jgi:eukaryotic-like serine/threonine-protein kinase
MNSSNRDFTVRLDPDSIRQHVAAFRTALELFGTAELTEFLPPREHAKYLEILSELIRLDMAHGWKIGKSTSLETYRTRFPDLGAKPALLYKIACEEFLLRKEAGEHPTMAEYRRRLELDHDDWPTARIKAPRGETAERPSPLSALDPETSSKLDIKLAGDTPNPSEALSKTRTGARRSHPSDPEIECRHFDPTAEMPKVGAEFLDFFLLAELGHGAFGKVFLAQQGAMAGRLVALKVAAGLFTESQTLAQLQHTHIVPIYSYHHAQPYQAVCMPYLGSTTLAHVLANLRSHKCMPSSGRDLLSTLGTRKKANGHHESAPAKSGRDKADAPAPPPVAPAPASFLALEGMSYVDSILWMAVRLTDGLAHAHERGIIHRDLKPANVLITDDGMPMLLDFNLAHDTKLRDSATAASMGGTLPYMAPEHLQAFQGNAQHVDARSDVYALGVILFELLTGASPFAAYRKLPMREVLERMVQDRQAGAPRLRPLNKAIPPAVEAIVLRCLEADPAKRYQTARQLQEDLQRQLEHKPLLHAANPSLWERAQKFRRRHPRLTSVASVGALASVIIAGLVGLLVVREDQRTRLMARETLDRFREDAQTTYFLLNARSARQQLDEGERACRAALAHYQILDQPAWRESAAVQRLPAEVRTRLEEEAGQLLVLLAHAQQLAGDQETDAAKSAERFRAGVHFCVLAGTCFKDEQTPQALWKQQGDLHRRLNDRELAEKCLERARQTDLKNAHDRFLAARLLVEEGKFRAALPLLREAIRLNPQDYHLHFLQGNCHDYLAQNAEAIACYRACIALRPSYFSAYYNRGLAQLRQNDGAAAVADFDQVVRLKPDFNEAYIQRALAYQGMSKNAEGIADLTTALERGFAETRVYFLRARLLERTRDFKAAKADFAEGLRREPTDELSWITRGMAFLPNDPKRALSDFDQALKLNPRSLAALQNKAHVLGKYFKRTEEAVQVLDRAVELYPDDVRPRAGRGVYLARLGKRAPALKDAEEALALDANPSNLYQVAGIYALTSRQEPDDQKEALSLLARAMKKGFGFEYLEIDRDLDPIRQSPTFRRVIEASRALQSAAPANRK